MDNNLAKQVMENNKNNETQNRREFFKEAAKKALPIFGAVALLSNPMIAKAVEKKTLGCQDCYYECGKTCNNNCIGSCEGNCTASCQWNCSGKCDVGCEQACSDNCSTRCTGSCRSECGGRCQTTCNGGCYNTCNNTCTAMGKDGDW